METYNGSRESTKRFMCAHQKFLPGNICQNLNYFKTENSKNALVTLKMTRTIIVIITRRLQRCEKLREHNVENYRTPRLLFASKTLCLVLKKRQVYVNKHNISEDVVYFYFIFFLVARK